MFRHTARAVVLMFALGGGLLMGNSTIAADNACGPIRATITKFNAVPMVRVSQRVINNGAGESGTRVGVAIDTRQYMRWNDGPWSNELRTYVPPESPTNCKSVGNDTIDGIATSVHRYDRHYDGETHRIEMWISLKTGLPVKSHITSLFPYNKAEIYMTYSYDANIKAPI